MARPDDIPEDVWEAAVKVELQRPSWERGYIGDMPNEVAVEVVARAILSDRITRGDASVDFEGEVSATFRWGGGCIVVLDEPVHGRKFAVVNDRTLGRYTASPFVKGKRVRGTGPLGVDAVVAETVVAA